MKGKATIRGTDRYFHLQITASGAGDLGNDSEAALFQKVPDVDQVRGMAEANKTTVVITLRGIGEMSTMNPDSQVGLATSPGDVDWPASRLRRSRERARAARGQPTDAGRRRPVGRNGLLRRPGGAHLREREGLRDSDQEAWPVNGVLP